MYVLVPGANFSSANSYSNTTNLEPKSSTEYDSMGIYDWSNFTSFTYRVPLEINSTFIDRTNYSVQVYVNFTQALDDAGYDGEEFDPDSVRVVEYEGTNPNYYPKLFNADEAIVMNRYVLPSLFIPLDKHDGYEAIDNAIGYIWFEMPGSSNANANRTFMVYFDTIENTGGSLVTPDSLIWKKDYNSNTDVLGDKMYHLAYGNYQDNSYEARGALSIWDENLESEIYHARPHSDIQRFLYPLPGDFNGDGNVELLISDRDNQFWLMDYNTITGFFNPLQTENGDPLNFDTVLRDYFVLLLGPDPYRWSTTLQNILIADIDNDGYDEIIASTYDRDYNYLVIMNITQDGSLNHILNVQQHFNTSFVDIQAMALADFNHDGYLDIIGADDDGGPLDVYGYTLYFWMNEGNGTFDNFSVTQPTHLGHGGMLPQEVRAISTGDIDNDGNIEIVTTDHDNHDFLYIWQWDMSNTTRGFDGTPEYEGTYDVPADPNFAEPVVGAMYDWDYDGYTEIIIGNSDASGNSSLAVIEIKGDETSYTGNDRIVQESEWGQWGNSSIPYHNLYFPRFGDIDNDGVVEMMSGTYRRWDIVNIYEPSVLVWNQDDTTAEWISPPAYNSIGGGGVTHQAMMNVFGAWDNYVCRQDPVVFIHEAGVKSPDLTINVLDMDLGPVYNAEVTITNGVIFTDTKTTDQSGQVNFQLLNDANYAVEINYSTPYHPEQTIYSDSVVIDSASQRYEEVFYVTPLQKVYFDVTDSTGGDFTYGKLVVWDDVIGGTVGDSINMGTNYEHTTWLAEQYINTSVQYTNPYYTMDSDYVLNSTNLEPEGNTTDSDAFDTVGNNPLGDDDFQYVFDFQQASLLNWIDIDIDISGATHYIDSIEVQLIFDVGLDTVYFEDIDGDTTDTWSGSISLWADGNGQLRLNSLRSDHVRIIVNAHNETSNTGTIDVDLFYQAVESITVPFREVQLEFIDTYDEYAEGFLIEVYETELDRSNNATLVNLTTNEFGEAFDLGGNPFYYFDDTASAELNYSIRAKFYKAYFDFAPNNDDHANFTNDGTVSYQFQINIDIGSIEYETNITVINTLSTNVDFDQDWNALILVTATDTGAPFAIDAYPVLKVYSVKSNTLVYQEDLVSNGTLGYYEITFNPQTDGITLGGDDYSYYVILEASTPGFGSGPIPQISSLTINPISTSVVYGAYEQWTWTEIAEFNITYLDRDSRSDLRSYRNL